MSVTNYRYPTFLLAELVGRVTQERDAVAGRGLASQGSRHRTMLTAIRLCHLASSLKPQAFFLGL